VVRLSLSNLGTDLTDVGHVDMNGTLQPNSRKSICTRCNEEKLLYDFPKNSNVCTECRRMMRKISREKDPLVHWARRNSSNGFLRSYKKS